MNERDAKRLIFEGVAIVLSILLAFAIDAWWDDRIERAEEREALEALYTEFLANHEQLLAVLERHDDARSSFAALLAMNDGEILALSTAQVEQMMRSFAYPRTFDAVRGSLDALIASGRLGIIQDRKLREALTSFDNVLDDAEEDRYYMAQTSMPVWYAIADLGGPWGAQTTTSNPEECDSPRPPRSCLINEAIDFLEEPTPADLVRLRNDEHLIGIAKQHNVVAARYASEVRHALYQVEDILRLLDSNRQVAGH